MRQVLESPKLKNLILLLYIEVFIHVRKKNKIKIPDILTIKEK